MDLKQHIRHVPDFPKAGILFYDITTLLRDPQGFKVTIDMLSAPFVGQGPESSLPALPGRMHVLLFSPVGAKAKLNSPMNGKSWSAFVAPAAVRSVSFHVEGAN